MKARLEPRVAAALCAALILGCSTPEPVLQMPRPPRAADLLYEATATIVAQLELGMPPGATSRVAVAPFDASSDATRRITESLTERIKNALASMPSVQLIEDPKMEEVQRQIRYQYDLWERGLLDASVRADLRGKLGAELVVLGRILDVGTDYEIHVRLVSLETGHALASSLAVLPARFVEAPPGRPSCLGVLEEGDDWLRVVLADAARVDDLLRFDFAFENRSRSDMAARLVAPRRDAYLIQSRGAPLAFVKSSEPADGEFVVPARSARRVTLWFVAPQDLAKRAMLHTRWDARTTSWRRGRKFVVPVAPWEIPRGLRHP